MADSKRPETPDTTTKATNTTAAESPTTARELDFEDELQENTAQDTVSAPKATSATASEPTGPEASDEVPPPQPPRPLTTQQEAENTLKEAFPGIDAAVVKAVLIASGGKIEPAFNALLGMSDPDAQNEPTPPPQPPRPRISSLAPQLTTSTPQTQLEADEMYARQLAEHYSGSAAYERRTATNRPPADRALPRQRQETGLKPNELYEEEHSFIDHDLPVIKENIKRTFLETQTKVNRWVADLKKKIDGEDDEDEDDEMDHSRTQGFNTGLPPQQYGVVRRSGEFSRRSGDRDRYDADPRVLGDDFAGLELRDEEAPRRSTRPFANPDLFKPTPSPPAGSRKVSFQAGPPELIKSVERKPSPASRNSKWEPLSTVEPSPIADNDPFSLGDSDDELDTKAKDGKSDDTASSKPVAPQAAIDSTEAKSTK